MGSENRGPALLGIDIAAAALAFIATVLRCFVRIRLVKSFGLDDWLMLGAMVSFALYSASSIIGVTYGTGQHVWDLTKENNSMAKKWWWCCYLTYSCTMLLTKLSIGYFLLRVTVNKIHRMIIYSMMIITVISCMAFFFVSAFQCWPVQYFWDKHTRSGVCINSDIVIGLAYMFSACSIISDFTFALLPAWIVSHLNMKPKTKAALIVLMGLGCFASAAVVIRIPYMKHLGSDDFLWDTTYVAIWSTTEECLAITAGCLATLQPLAKTIGYKMGLASRPSLPGFESGYNSYKMTGEISVRRSFTRRTETFSSMANPLSKQPIEEDATGLKLQPGFSQYSAVCYNTTSSQEELRPGEADVGTVGSRVQKEEDDGILPSLPVIRTKEVRQ
ncbi:hypothetical protein QBC38DRAFT_107047 [Podospora fimiseda]|uniref:Rhodopsin domain-containing protein n=1 Tax=Podospora fimiseda TaxID=252190 RepID=A0AAN7BFU8_9PEZI|nr:hypothetical protein QBC38DRAFT_107047 [Podospora fimiseda]